MDGVGDTCIHRCKKYISDNGAQGDQYTLQSDLSVFGMIYLETHNQPIRPNNRRSRQRTAEKNHVNQPMTEPSWSREAAVGPRLRERAETRAVPKNRPGHLPGLSPTSLGRRIPYPGEICAFDSNTRSLVGGHDPLNP